MGLNTTIGRTGSVLSFIIASHIFAASQSLAFSFWVGSLLLTLSLLFAVSTILLNQHVERTTGYSPQRAESRKIVLKDLTKLSGSFWVITLTAIGYYTAFLSFMTIAPAFAMDRFGVSDKAAGVISVLLR